WEKEFGKDLRVKTPIGYVKMGENQYEKMIKQRRQSQLGMIKPTLTKPDIIIEENIPDEIKKLDRDTNFIFIKAFLNNNKAQVFECVSIKIEGLEVIISSHLKKENQIIAKI